MKIAEWTLHVYRLPYVRDIQWVYAAESSGDYALLKIVADNGATGFAEGVIKPTRTGYSPRALGVALEDVILPQLRKVDIADANAVAAALQKVPENRLAKAMVDNACWTLRAAVAEKPLWQYWGGKREVEICWMVTRQTPTLMAIEADAACSRHGVRALKIQGGQGRDTDLRTIAAVRAAVGKDVELSVDANGSYTREEALDYVRALAVYYESALGTLISLQQAAALSSPRPLPSSHSFFMMLKSQITRFTPQIKNGKIELPNEPDLEKFIDWKAVQRLQF